MMDVRNHVALATTFRPEEVAVVCLIFARLLSGGDVTQLVRSPAGRSAYAKFLRMGEKGDRA